MAKIEKLDERRQDDRLTAHLALGTEQPPVAGACLSADQLADVATGYCSEEERKVALAHFSTCSSCYDAWVAVSLSLVAMESGTTRKKSVFGSIRNLSYIGSALAIAASVVVFLNIRDIPLEKTISPPAKSRVAPMQQMMPDKDKDILNQEERSREVPVAPRAPAASKESARSMTKPVARMESDAKKQDAVGAGVPPVVLEVGADASESSPVAQMTTVATEQEDMLSAVEWLSRLEAGCRDKGSLQDQQWWTHLREQGSIMVDKEVDPLLHRKLTAVLEVMANTDEYREPQEQCRMILTLLAGEGDKE